MNGQIIETDDRYALATVIRIYRPIWKRTAGIRMANQIARGLIAYAERTAGVESRTWYRCVRCGHVVKEQNVITLDNLMFCPRCAREFVAER